MATLNKVMLIGRLTDNPEPPRTLPNSGSTVVKFRFAVGRSKKNPQTGQWDPDPNPLYIDCEAFSRSDAKFDLVGLISQYAKKGDPLYIEGRLQLDQWEDKNGGGKRSKHKVVVESVQLLGGNRGDDGGGGGMGGENRASRPMSGGGTANRAPAQQRDNYPPPQHDGGDESGGGGNGEDIPF